MESLSLMLVVDLLLLFVELLFVFLVVVEESLRGETERRIVVEFIGVREVEDDVLSVVERVMRVGGRLDDIVGGSSSCMSF